MDGKSQRSRKRKLKVDASEVMVVEAHVTKPKHKKVATENGKAKHRQEQAHEEGEEISREKSAELVAKSVLSLDGNLYDCCLIFLKKDQKLVIQGKVQVRPLLGSVNILGSILKPSGHFQELFSPISSSLLTLQDCSGKHGDKVTKESIKEVLCSQSANTVKIGMTRAQKASSVLLIKKLNTTETNFVCQYKPYGDIFGTDVLKEAELSTTLNKSETLLKDKTSPLGFALFEADPERLAVFHEPNEWRQVIQSIEETKRDRSSRNPSILVCGGKGVGKSSFARYTMNVLLNSHQEVFYLDCDVGQTEFTPPAILSLSKLSTHVTLFNKQSLGTRLETQVGNLGYKYLGKILARSCEIMAKRLNGRYKPELGPPSTHLKWPERAYFFGDVTPKDSPDYYIRCIESLYRHYVERHSTYENIPLIINTQGWVKGMGISLLMDVIRITQPSHIVQISSQSQPTKNLPTITGEFLDSTPGWVFPIPGDDMASGEGEKKNKNQDDDMDEAAASSSVKLLKTCQTGKQKHPVVFQLEACAKEDQGSGLRSSDYRTMNLLAYFSHVQGTLSASTLSHSLDEEPIPLTQYVPYNVPWGHVAVHVMHTEVPRSQVLFSLNASVVALAISPPSTITERDGSYGMKFLKTSPMVECVGLGIIRNIDPVNKLFYVLTPVPLDTLQKVNTLLKGNLEIPAALWLQETKPGAPYVSSEFSYELKGAGARRVRYNLLRKKYNSPAKPGT